MPKIVDLAQFQDIWRQSLRRHRTPMMMDLVVSFLAQCVMWPMMMTTMTSTTSPLMMMLRCQTRIFKQMIARKLWDLARQFSDIGPPIEVLSWKLLLAALMCMFRR